MSSILRVWKLRCSKWEARVSCTDGLNAVLVRPVRDRWSCCRYVCLSKAEGTRVCMLNSKVGRLFGLNLIKRSVQILNQEATEEKGKRELIVSWHYNTSPFHLLGFETYLFTLNKQQTNLQHVVHFRSQTVGFFQVLRHVLLYLGITKEHRGE